MEDGLKGCEPKAASPVVAPQPSASSGAAEQQTSEAPPNDPVANLPPLDIDGFIRENELDERAAHELRESTYPVQAQVLGLGRINSCTNPSAICVARLRTARRSLTVTDPAAEKIDASEIASKLEVFLSEIQVDSRASSVFRAQPVDIQKAVIDRGNLADCDNQSTALMGRIKAAIDTSNLVKDRLVGGSASQPRPLPPVPVNEEVEEFIRENKVDEAAAKQLRYVDREIQDAVLARGGLERCRNPSAVIGARIREAREEIVHARKEELERRKLELQKAAAFPMMGGMMMMPSPALPMMNPMMASPMMTMMNPMAMMSPMAMMNPMAMVNPMMAMPQPAMMSPMVPMVGCAGCTGMPTGVQACAAPTACATPGTFGPVTTASESQRSSPF